MLQFMVIVHAAPGANNYSVFFDDVFHGFCAVGFLPSVLTSRGRRSEQPDSALSCSSRYYTLSSHSSFFFFFLILLLRTIFINQRYRNF